MPHDELRNAAHAIVARLQSDFDAHLSRLDDLHNQAREDSRRQAEARAAEEWTAKLEAERADWQRRIEAVTAEAQAAAGRHEQMLADVRSQAERYEKTLADVRSQAERYEKSLAEARSEAERHEKSLAEARSDAERHEKSLAEARSDAERQEKALAEARAQAERHERALAEARVAAEQQEAALVEARAEAERRAMAQAEADRRAAAAVAAIQAETDRRAVALAEAQKEAERRITTEAVRVRAEVEQAATLSAERMREELEKRAEEGAARVREEMQQAAAQSMARLREEMEAAAGESAARLKEDMERGLAAERERAGNEINAERARMHAELSTERDRMAAEIDGERVKAQGLSASLEETRLAVTVAETELRSARGLLEELRATLTEERDAARAAAASMQQSLSEEAITTARAAERQSQLSFVERLLAAVQAIGTARSLSDTLTTLASAAASIAPRVALFVVNDRGEASGGREFQGWRATGFGDRPLASFHLTAGDGGVVASAASLARPVSTATASAPAFAGLRSDRAALGVPIVVGGKSVAVLYADDGTAQESEAPASWPEAMQILGAHASAWLTQITAVRTTQAMRATGGRFRDAAPATEDDSSARRYARLLVSEIKLYNEAAVRSGREKRDLLQRLRPEIERARRLYEERVPPSIGARAVYFQDELVHTLADGDATLLGSA